MKLINSLSVKWKIYAIAIASLIGFAGYLAFNTLVISVNSKVLEGVQKESFPLLEIAKKGREQIDQISELFNTSVTIGELDFVEQAVSLTQHLNTSLNRAKLIDPSLSSRISKIQDALARYQEHSAKIAIEMINETVDFNQLPELVAEKESVFQRLIDHQNAFTKYAAERFGSGIETANRNSRELLEYGFLFWIVNVAILAISAFAVSRVILTNIVGVAESLEEIAKGDGDLKRTIKVRSSDEIGQLAISFNHLMENLRERTNDLSNMMQNMHQGIFTIIEEPGHKLSIHPEYAAYIEDIFETKEIAGKSYFDLLFSRAQLGSDELDQIDAALKSVIKEDVMMFDFNKHVFPTEMIVSFPDRRKLQRDENCEQVSRTKILEIDWDPIVSEDIVDKMMVTIRDVTTLRAAAQKAEEQREELEIIGQILHITPEKFTAFLANTHDLLAENQQLIRANKVKNLDVIAQLFANMHTVKGNTRTYGFNKLTDLIHDAESSYDLLRKDAEAKWDQVALLKELDNVMRAVTKYESIKEQKLNLLFASDTHHNKLSIEPSTYQKLMKDYDRVARSVEGQELTQIANEVEETLLSIGTQPLKSMLKEVTHSLPSLAQELDKAPPNISFSGADIKFYRKYQDLFNNIFTHVLRNAVDHGIEDRETRRSKGKEPVGNISIVITPEVNKLKVTISDDGKGLALHKIRDSLVKNGRCVESLSDSDIANTIFESGISTAKEVTNISGRGVGMDAVRKFLNKEGADIQIVLAENSRDQDSFVKFETHICLPKTMYIHKLSAA